MSNSKKRAIEKKKKTLKQQEQVIESRRMLRRYVKELQGFLVWLQRYAKFGTDLYLTSNYWLFTEETRAGGSKIAEAVDTILLCRKFNEEVLRQYMTITQHIARAELLLEKLKQTKDPIAIADQMIELLSKTTEFGEAMGDTVINNLKPVYDKYKDDIKEKINVPFYNAFTRIVEDAQTHLAQMREINLNNLSDEEKKITEKIEEMLEHPENIKECDLSNAFNELAGGDALKDDAPGIGDKIGQDTVVAIDESPRVEPIQFDGYVAEVPVLSSHSDETDTHETSSDSD